MKKHSLFIWLLPTLFCAHSPGAESVLENASTRLVIQDCRIISLYDKIRGVEHAVGGNSKTSMLKIQLVAGIKLMEEIDARDMQVELSSTGKDALAISYVHAQAKATAIVRLSETPGEIAFSLAASPQDPRLAFARINFPAFETPNQDTGGEKTCLLPYREGRLSPISRPICDEEKLNYLTYPKHLFSQMIACLGKSGGFLFWTDDVKGHVKEFGRDYHKGNSTFAIKHFTPYAAGQSWDQAYQARITFTGPAWQDAADIYRAWTARQSWSAVKLKDRQDIPAILKAPPVCVSGQIDKEDLSALPGKLKAWGNQYQAPAIYRPLGWEKHGNWMGIDYFPVSVGDRRFRETADRLRNEGVAVAGFISGFAWKTRPGKGEGSDAIREATARLLEQHFREQNGNALCEQDRDGKVRGPARVCRGTGFGQTFLQDTAKRLMDLGVSVIHDDVDYGTFQFTSEGCFNKAHGHPIPCGIWEIDTTRKAFQEIKEEAKRRGIKEFFITKEYYTELLNQDIHASQARFFKAANEPHHVPLAQYLFHEYVFSIFGWGCDNKPLSAQTAMLLVYGQIPCFPSWGNAIGKPGNNRMVMDYYEAMKTHAKEFLLFGKMRRPLATEDPSNPPIIQSAWDDDRGNVGVFAVNNQRKEVVLKVPLPGAGKWRGTFYLGESQQQTLTFAAGKTLEWRLPSGRLASVVLTPIK